MATVTPHTFPHAQNIQRSSEHDRVHTEYTNSIHQGTYNTNTTRTRRVPHSLDKFDARARVQSSRARSGAGFPCCRNRFCDDISSRVIRPPSHTHTQAHTNDTTKTENDGGGVGDMEVTTNQHNTTYSHSNRGGNVFMIFCVCLTLIRNFLRNVVQQPTPPPLPSPLDLCNGADIYTLRNDDNVHNDHTIPIGV